MICLSGFGTFHDKIKAFKKVKALILLWDVRDSNPRPRACEARALNRLS